MPFNLSKFNSHRYIAADELEAALGIGFVRHSSKKPSGTADALQDRFGCETSEMVMLGKESRPRKPTDHSRHHL